MKENNSYKIEGIFDNTRAVFDNARTILRTKAEILEFADADPNNLRIEIIDYASAIDMLDDLIVDDTIVDEDAFNIIYQLADKFYIYTRDDYPGIRCMMKNYMSELDNHYMMRFDA